MRYLIIKTCMLLAFSSVLTAQQSDIAKMDSTSLNPYARIITRQDLQRLPFRGESQDYYNKRPLKFLDERNSLVSLMQTFKFKKPILIC